MQFSTPEKVGIKSQDIYKYIQKLENAQLSTHDLIIMRKGKIVFEKYWEPFHENFLHRMYSVTKSYVAIAIGFCEQDGLLNLDDPISKFFQEELKNQSDENVKNQTIRQMLMMTTARCGRNWFVDKTDDRVYDYFNNKVIESHPAGTMWAYDSTGSFILGALVERLTGMELIEYLRIKLLDEIGFSKNAYMLKCPGGHSWGDSALLCTARDLLRVAMFCMNKGKWNGKQLLNERFMRIATSKQVDNNVLGLNEFDTQGYGYQIWMSYGNSFFLNGMGCQLALCIPDKDLIMVYNGDNQGNVLAKKIIIDNFFEIIADSVDDNELGENEIEISKLSQYSDNLKLFSAKGLKYVPIQDDINNVTYEMNKNKMGIKTIKLAFDGDKGILYYTNEQGEKQIPFGMCRNEFSKFPQHGYSDMVGTLPGTRLYDCASSAAWVFDNQLFIKVQIIDTYFGNLNINLGFVGSKITVNMNKSAEDFLEEYQGIASGIAKK